MHFFKSVRMQEKAHREDAIPLLTLQKRGEQGFKQNDGNLGGSAFGS